MHVCISLSMCIYIYICIYAFFSMLYIYIYTSLSTYIWPSGISKIPLIHSSNQIPYSSNVVRIVV